MAVDYSRRGVSFLEGIFCGLQGSQKEYHHFQGTCFLSVLKGSQKGHHHFQCPLKANNLETSWNRFHTRPLGELRKLWLKLSHWLYADRTRTPVEHGTQRILAGLSWDPLWASRSARGVLFHTFYLYTLCDGTFRGSGLGGGRRRRSLSGHGAS